MQIYDCYLKGFLQFCTNKGYTSVHHKDTIFRTAHQQQLTAPIFKLLMAWSNNPGHAKSREELICSLDTLRTVTAWWTQDQQAFYNQIEPILFSPWQWEPLLMKGESIIQNHPPLLMRVEHHTDQLIESLLMEPPLPPRPAAGLPPPPPRCSPGRRRDCPLRCPSRRRDCPTPVVESALKQTFNNF